VNGGGCAYAQAVANTLMAGFEGKTWVRFGDLERDRMRLTQSEGVNHAIKQKLIYPAQRRTRKSLGEMIRKLSVT
jgi:hypothetical protein